MSNIVLHSWLASDWKRKAGSSHLCEASEGDLRYGLFLGDIEFKVNDYDLSAKWGWVPLIDFAVGLLWLLRRLPDSRHEIFQFTESGAELRFYLMDHGAVEIRTNYVPATATVRYLDLLDKARDHAEATMNEIESAAPSLSRNVAFQRLKEA